MAQPANPATPSDAIPAELRALTGMLAAGRIVIGAALMLAPERALGALGFEDASEATIAVARLAGVRDIVLGAAQAAAAGDRERLRRSTLACAAADAGDAAVFANALAGSGDARLAGARGLAAAGPATLTGIWAAWRLSQRAGSPSEGLRPASASASD